jgi:biopolymer transport protein TolQ
LIRTVFRKGRSYSEIGAACDTMRWTPLAPVFNAGLDALEPRGGAGNPASRTRASAATLERVLDRTAAAQLTLLERRLTFLATTASAAPFIGLFGTVVGVMTSFANLGTAETATLKAVAPGIAEALIATGFGLFAAIPSVIAYNHFVNKLRGIAGQLDDLKSEVLSYAERSGI